MAITRALAQRALAAALMLAATPAAAEETGLEDITVFGWSLDSLRVGFRIEPDYMGSNDYQLRPSGNLAISRRGAQPAFAAPDDGVSIGLLGGPRLSAGLSGRWRGERDNDNDLRGFDKIDWTVEAGGFVNFWPTDWLRLRGELRHGFGGHDSWVADLGADAIKRKGPWVVSVGPRLSWADDNFTRTYFGVTPLEASRSPFGIAPYTPGGSSVIAGVLGSAEYRLSRHWSVTGFASYRRLMGDAADSPIVQDLGSRDQFSATLGVRYMIGR